MNKNLIDFFLKTGEVKRMKQRGFVLRRVKDPVRIGGHAFREAIMGWTIAKSSNTGLDCDRIIKLALLHDLCRGHAGDITPYDPVLTKYGGKKVKTIYKKWIRLSKREKERFFKQSEKKEYKALLELIKTLPTPVANEMKTLWSKYASRTTRESRFVYQLHVLENFIQALEYWEQDKSFPIESWWQQMKETISDPPLLELLQA
ncbi:HD domain-containing protein, partial [Patescibacteria group bacterium]|nr:HD domain-containing protein [Patescibacteria group bacterium]